MPTHESKNADALPPWRGVPDRLLPQYLVKKRMEVDFWAKTGSQRREELAHAEKAMQSSEREVASLIEEMDRRGLTASERKRR